MADITRTSAAVWHGDLLSGKGEITTGSGVIKDQPYSFSTRFENEPGTNPEELVAAAYAACFSMAFANTLKERGYDPGQVSTQVTCTLSPQSEGGFRITHFHVNTHGKVSGLDANQFNQIAKEVSCPVSVLIENGVGSDVESHLDNG